MTGVTVYTGVFASQRLAYAHVPDAAEARGLDLDLTHVEVIQGPPARRLAHVSTAADAAQIEAGSADADTLVLVFPEALAQGDEAFDRTERLAPLGRFAPIRPRRIA